MTAAFAERALMDAQEQQCKIDWLLEAVTSGGGYAEVDAYWKGTQWYVHNNGAIGLGLWVFTDCMCLQPTVEQVCEQSGRPASLRARHQACWGLGLDG